MNPDLKTLVELQKLDDTIRALTAEIQSLPQIVAGIEGQLAEHVAKAEAEKKRLADNQRERRRRETEIAVQREKITRYKDQMFEVKTNEQYRALLHEIEFHEGEIRKLEDHILVEMIESESLEKDLREAQQNLAEERSRASEQVQAVGQRKQQQEEKLSVTAAHRKEAQTQLAPNIYGNYERIASYRKGVAVAEVHNGACGACNVCLRPQAYNEVTTNEQILNCESCGCILYYVPQPAAQ